MRHRLARLVGSLALPFALVACGSGGGVITFGGGSSGSNDATLSSLTLSQGSLDPEFSPDTTLYVAGPSFFAELTTVTATTTDPGASMTYRVNAFLDPIPLVSGVASDPFGFDIEISFLVIEVTAQDGVTTKSYNVAIRRATPEGLETYVKASNTGTGDWFGHAVATSGNTIVVGAPFEDSNAVGVDGNQANSGAPGSGAAYVFVYEEGVWTQQAYLKASNTGVGDEFGSSVAISGDTIVVGAQKESSDAVGVGGDQSNDDALTSGAAYVFVRTGVLWTQQAYLKASNTGQSDEFGNAVSIDGDRIAVGAYAEDSDAAGIDGDQGNDDAFNSGAVYLFTRAGGLWSQEAYVKASNAQVFDVFGTSLALNGTRLAVGAPGEDSNATGINGNQGNNGALSSGAVYLFTKDDLGWFEEAYVKASNTGLGDSFGASVSMASAVFVIETIDGVPIPFELFTLVVGAPLEASDETGTGGLGANDLAPASGAAYVFTSQSLVLFPLELEQVAYLKSSNSEGGDRFGTAVACVAGTVVVGAPGESSDAGGLDGDESNDDALSSGAVYVFFEEFPWLQQAYVKASNARPGDEFGAALSLASGTLVVGARLEISDAVGINGNQAGIGAPNSGAVYVVR